MKHIINNLYKLGLSALLLFVFIFVIESSYALDNESIDFPELPENSSSEKVDPIISKTQDEISNTLINRGNDDIVKFSNFSNPLLKVDEEGRIEVYIHYVEINDNFILQLVDYGLEVIYLNENLRIIQGWIPFEIIDHIVTFEYINKITRPSYGHTRVGSITTEGDAPMKSDEARNSFGVDGTGVLIGVISDGVDSRVVSQATGDLPSNINIGDPGEGDEGTAMLEIVHDIAPGADLAFHGGFESSLQFIEAIEFFMNIGADIIVDDLGYLDEPYFQDGALAQKAQQAVDSGIIYMSSGGNSAQEHYQSIYVDDGPLDIDDDLHDFGLASGGTSTIRMPIEIPAQDSTVAVLQWSDPFGSSSNNYDLFLTENGTSNILDASTIIQDGNDDPIEVVFFENPTVNPIIVDLIIRKTSGTPQTLEINFNLGGFPREFNVSADSVYGHPAALGALAICAYRWNTPNEVEFFSSHGPSSIISPSDAFISSTSRALISEQRPKPDLCAPDGVSTTVPGFTTFFGTSAAAPHAAAVASLVLEAINKSQTNTSAIPLDVSIRQVEQVKNALTQTAVDMLQPGFDSLSGFGRIDALAAVASVLVCEPVPGGGIDDILAQEICDNGIDDNGDGLVDCLDPKCMIVEGGGGGDAEAGDGNGDGNINVADVVLVINLILGVGEATGNADCNGDETINVADVVCIINKILGL